MPRPLLAIPVVLAFALAVPPVASANPERDFAGSHTPARAKHPAAAAASTVSLASMPLGPDVSNWNGCSINWLAVAKARAFAFAKATEGTNFTDRCFAGSWWQMAGAGLARGAYHFARPSRSLRSARAQARRYVAVVNSAGGFVGGVLPPVLDVEVKARGTSRSAMRAWIRAWIREVRAETHRYWVTIYTGNWFWRPNVGRWAPRGTLLWASGYTNRRPSVAGFRQVSWWQYTDGHYGPIPHFTPGIGRSDSSVWLRSSARLSSVQR